MMKHLSLTPELYAYMLDVSLKEHPALQQCREETEKLPLGVMQVAPEQAQFFQFLLRLMKAKNVLELGTFTGYSALAMALALPEDGRVITCDLSDEWTTIAKKYWKGANQDHKIDLRLGQASDSLNQLNQEGWDKRFDFIFIDADKSNYLNYYESALNLIQPGGVIAVDNVFWSGKVIDSKEIDAQTREIKKLNDHIKHDDRVYTSFLPIADGIFLIQPKVLT